MSWLPAFDRFRSVDTISKAKPPLLQTNVFGRLRRGAECERIADTYEAAMLGFGYSLRDPRNVTMSEAIQPFMLQL